MTDKQKKQATRKIRREAIRIQNTSTIKLSMAEALQEVERRRNNPDA